MDERRNSYSLVSVVAMQRDPYLDNKNTKTWLGLIYTSDPDCVHLVAGDLL